MHVTFNTLACFPVDVSVPKPMTGVREGFSCDTPNRLLGQWGSATSPGGRITPQPPD